MQSMMGAYMEQSKKLFMQMQEQIQNQTRTIFSGFQFPAFGVARPGEAEEQPAEKTEKQ